MPLRLHLAVTLDRACRDPELKYQEVLMTRSELGFLSFDGGALGRGLWTEPQLVQDQPLLELGEVSPESGCAPWDPAPTGDIPILKAAFFSL